MILAAVPSYQIECRFEAGLSEESQDIRAKMDEFRRKSREPISFSWRESVRQEIEGALRSRSQAGWDGYDAQPLSLESANGALRIISALPDHFAPPSVTPEPDGEIALEWSDDKKTFAVSLSGATLVYAGVFGGTCKKYGEEPFFGALSPTILRILAEYFSKA
jgi:hypothetical protein